MPVLKISVKYAKTDCLNKCDFDQTYIYISVIC